MESIIGTIVVGLVAGVIAKLIMPGKDPGGCIITTLLGIAGAFLGTWLGQFLGLFQGGGFSYLAGAVVGAVLILAIYRLVVKKK